MQVSIIGAGRMGRKHIYAVRKLELNLSGLVDNSEEALEAARREHGLNEQVLFESSASLYNSMIPDCLIIATTAESHCDLTCTAAERGVKYILVEKPMAVSLEECDRMIDICNKYGVQLSVNHQMRFMEQYSKPKSLLNSVAYGGFKSMTVVGGNFGMSMNGTHYLEAFRYMSDEDPVEVTAWFDSGVVTNPRGVQFEDRAGSIRIVTASGKRLYLEIGESQGHGLTVTYAGRNGMIYVNELNGQMTTSLRQSQYRELPTTRYGMPDDTTTEVIKPVEVIDSTAMVLNALIKDENRVSAERGRMAVQVLVAAYKSAEEGSRPIRLDEQLDRTRVFPWA